MTDKPLDMFWFIPVSGDGPYLGSEKGHRPPDFRYLREIAQAADRLGYSGALLPVGKNCDDPFIVAAALASHTERLKFLTALRPGFATPAHFARQTAAADRLSNGRFMINVVTGGHPLELAGDGIFLSHDERYRHTAEFLTIYRRLLAGERVDFDGEFLKATGAQLGFAPVQKPFPIWFGGSSDAAQDVAAEHVDVYLTWGEPLDQVADKIDKVRRKARARGREVKFGLRMHFVVRETEAEAWAAADRLIADLSDDVIDLAQRKFARESDSVGQKRMTGLRSGGRSRDALTIAPNLWAGVGLVRGGAGTALVGDPKTVALRLREYQALGIETIIGSGYPHLEEAYRVAELLFPELGIGQQRKPVGAGSQAEFGTSGTGVRIVSAS